MSLLLKIKIGNGDIRRTQIDRPRSFAALHASLSKYLDSANKPELQNFRILYEDDEKDLISLLDDADLCEALRQVDSSPSKILRVTISGSVTEPKKCKYAKKCTRKQVPRQNPNPANFGQHYGGQSFGHNIEQLLSMASASLPDLLSNPALRGIAEGLMTSGSVKVVTNYVCDNCNGAIAGDRYSSTTQENFDVCSGCYKSVIGERLEQIHKFKKICALEALVDCLRNGGTFDASFAEGKSKEDLPVAHHALCDRCDQPIVGVRHKCLDCADYDECNVCHYAPNTVAHMEGHIFYEINDNNVRKIPEDVLKVHNEKRQAERKETERKEAERKEMERKEAERKEAERKEAERKEAERMALEKQKELERLERLKPIVAPKPSAPPKFEEKETSAFEKNLQTLESMGFTDRKKNIQVLVRNRNKLFESIQELLQ